MQFKFCVFTYYFHGIKLIFPLQVPFYLSMSDRKPTAQFLFWPELSAHPTRLARYFQTTRPFWHVTYNVPEGPGVVASFRRMRTYRNRPVWHAGRSGTPHLSERLSVWTKGTISVGDFRRGVCLAWFLDFLGLGIVTRREMWNARYGVNASENVLQNREARTVPLKTCKVLGRWVESEARPRSEKEGEPSGTPSGNSLILQQNGSPVPRPGR